MSAVAKWFVMVYSQSGEHVMPLVSDDGDPVLFDTEDAARKCADEHHFASAFGFDVYGVGG